MLLPIRVEVPTRRLEIRPLALRRLVNVHRMFACRQVLQIELEVHALFTLFQCSRANAFALGIL